MNHLFPKYFKPVSNIKTSAETAAESNSKTYSQKVLESQKLLASLIKIKGTQVFNLKAYSCMEKQENTKKLSNINKKSVKELIKDKADNGRKRKAHIPLKIHGRNRIYRTKTSILRHVCIILTDLFGNSFESSRYPLLIPEHLQLIETVMGKKIIQKESIKYKNRFHKTQEERLEYLQELEEFRDSNKRTEENLKFIYKHTLKFLKSQFYEEKGLKYNKESELDFYRFYFGEISKRKGISLDLYFDPLLSNKSEGKSSKTISNNHLKLVFENEEFKRKFFEYVDDQFREDYQSSILKKIERMFIGLENKLKKQTEQERRDTLLSFISVLEQKKRVKFPWNTVEIETSKVCFYQRLKKIGISC